MLFIIIAIIALVAIIALAASGAVAIYIWQHRSALAARPVDHTQADVDYQETFKQLQARTHELETLHQMGLDLATTLNLDKVLEAIMLAAVRLLEVEMGALFLYQSQSQSLKLVARFQSPLPIGYELKPGEGLAGQVWQSNEPLVIDSYQTWSERMRDIGESIGERSSMGAPINYGEEKVGVLAVSAQDGRFYSDHDVELLTFFIPSAALAIHNARLYQQVQTELTQRQQLETQLRAVVSSTPLVLFVLDKEGVFQLSEGKSLKSLGLEPSEVVGRSVFEVYRDMPEVVTYVRRALEGETVNTIIHIDTLAFNTWLSPQYDAAHSLSGVLGVALDVTTHEQATNALRRQNDYLAALHQVALDLLNHRQEQSLLQSIVEQTAELFEAAYCTLALWNGQELIIRATTHQWIDEIGSPVRNLEGMLGLVYASGQLLVMNEYAGWAGRRASLSGLQLQTAVAVPILDAQQCIGTLALARPDASHTFDTEQVYLLTLLAQMAALVLQHAQLYEASQHELTERKQAEEALRASEEWLQAVLASMDDLVFVLDRQGKFVDYYQPQANKALYVLPEDFLGESYKEMLPPAIVTGLTAVLKKITQSDQVEKFEYALPCGKEEKWFSANVSGRNDRHGQFDGVTIVVRDITDYKETAAQLRQFALYDGLTGLPNRRLLMERLAKAIQDKQQHIFALLFLDLDRFKIINDSLGHQVGDGLLISIARLLESCVREHDIVTRLGGDEFVVLLTKIHSETEARRVAERILGRMTRPFYLSGHTVHTSASIGLIADTIQYENPDEVLRHADIAMYQAKLGGKARYELFDLSQQSQAADLWQIERDLRRALAEDELVVYYQPMVSLANGRWRGVEALVRWQHPKRGLLDPGVFLPVAEEAGLLVAINEWALRKSCQQLQAWHQAGYSFLRLTVNISAVQLQQEHTLTFVEDTLQQFGLPHQALGLEITERFSARTKEYIPTLTALHEQGVGILIDDFGIGSSLESLKLFPLDELKINQTFVQGMTRDTYDQAIIRAIIALAHSLGLQVIAEGVETAEQLAYLQAEGCDEAQGCLFSPPATAEEIVALLSEPNLQAIES